MRKIVLFTMLALINVVAWAADGDYAAKLVISTDYDKTVTPGYLKFQEPLVKVEKKENGKLTNLTNFYDIEYYFDGQESNEVIKNHRNADCTIDTNTGAQIERLFGDLRFDRVGRVTVKVIAKLRSDNTQQLTGTYSVTVAHPAPVITFTPNFMKDGESNDVINLNINQKVEKGNDTWNENYYYTTLSKSSAVLPSVKITTLINNIVTDITDKYTITPSVSLVNSEDVNKVVINSDSKGTSLSYNAPYKQEFKGGDLDANRQAAEAFYPASGAKLTYKFAVKNEFEGQYNEIADKVVAINFIKTTSTEKQSIHLSLPKALILEDDVDCADDTQDTKYTDDQHEYTIHVYKYGSQDHTDASKYQYCTPNPAIMTSAGSQLPAYCTRGAGGWGDFQYFYEIVEDRTYEDDCQVVPFNAIGDYTKAGDKTGITMSQDKFQTSKPGFIRVAVYAALENNAAKQELIDLYQPIMVENAETHEQTPLIKKNGWGTQYTIYSEPVYFNIDVMKRIPTLSFSPDPSTLQFVAGDRIDMTNRFDVSGSITDKSNGIAGNLIWGGNEGYTEVDHFAYTFFISDHAAQVIKVHNWPCTFTKEVDGKIVADRDKWAQNEWTNPYTGETFYGDQYSYICWQPLTEKDNIIIRNNDNDTPAETKSTAAVGDKVKVAAGTGDGGSDYVLVTEDNLDIYKNHVLEVGDMVKGITYFSTKGYGAAFEKWYLEFLYESSYAITYTIRPWNHTRWDVGNNEAGSVTYTYNVVQSVDTEIKLSYDIANADKGDAYNFDEPDAKVVVKSSQNDVTEHFNLHYEIDPSNNTTANEYKIEDETISSDGDNNGVYSVYYNNVGTVETPDWQPVLKVRKDDGQVYVGDVEAGDVKIMVSATRKPSTVEPAYEEQTQYNNPAPTSYIVRIIEKAGRAAWEIMSSCKHEACSHTSAKFTDESSRARFTGDIAAENGRFHFIGAGNIYGGTVIKGVPGMVFTVGAPSADAESGAEWSAVASDIATLKLCCNHEAQPVIVEAGRVQIDGDGIPTSGTFYKFEPTASGFLSIDANCAAGTTVKIISRNSKTGEVISEDMHIDTTAQGDHAFQKALIAGETYYVYNVTNGNLRLHGFTYHPAFVKNRDTKVTDEPILASMFMNGFSNAVPTIIKSNDGTVEFSITPAEQDYAEVDADGDGEVKAKKMTINADGTINNVEVHATVKSSDASLGACVAKEAIYHLQIIDIPTYKIEDYDTYTRNNGISNRQQVRTTNIPTAITMTFGGWEDNDNVYASTKEDQWSYKSAAGPASRIGSEKDDDDPTFNITIDGFGYYNAGNQNPIDENNKGALQKDDGKGNLNNGDSYTFASGTAAEKSISKYYNTTYRLPCRGAYLKFEPEESGTVLLYIVQNGSVDYHYGIANVSSQYQLKWRPLYITDETGKPMEMVSDFSSFNKYLPSDNQTGNLGAFTLGLSRCNKKEPAIAEASEAAGVTGENKEAGCDFDWSLFRGTQHDRESLMDAWPDYGEQEQVITLDNGGFALPHKAYVRYAFNVKAGKTYFVFQPGSKFEFGGFSFVPTGYPNTSKYGLTWANNSDADIMNWVGNTNATNQESNVNLTWNTKESIKAITNKENINVTLYDADNTEKHRTFTAGKWNSICLPFSVNEPQMKKAFGDGYLLVTVDGIDDQGRLNFVCHANGYIEAGRPYLFKPTKGYGHTDEEVGLVFNNVTIEAGETSLVTGKADIIDPTRFDVPLEGTNFNFKGFYEQHELPQGAVFAASDGLYASSKTSKLGGYRALFNVPAPQAAKSMEFRVTNLRHGSTEGDDNTTTGIIYVMDEEIHTLPSNVGVYSLDGQKLGNGKSALDKMQKGVYIVNGKKFVVK